MQAVSVATLGADRSGSVRGGPFDGRYLPKFRASSTDLLGRLILGGQLAGAPFVPANRQETLET